MTLTELRYMVALAQQKHFGKAAIACHVSQPTLSVAINKLELKLNVSIFERNHNEVRITDIGEKIVAQALRALEEIAVISEIANANKSQLNSPLRIGCIYTVAPYLFPLLIPQLNKLAPNMPIMIDEDLTANLRVKLQRGELDLIFISCPFTEDGIVVRPLYEEPLVVLMKKGHRLINKKMISNTDLVGENILLLGEGHCLRDQIMKACPHCFTANAHQKTVEGSSLETLRHMVASGFGITLLPCSATQVKYYQSILVVKPFKSTVPIRTIGLAWRVSFPRTKAVDVIIQAISACRLNGICLLPET
jgi:LysR family hydrogen peroxide-inducible transcriptional activator